MLADRAAVPLEKMESTGDEVESDAAGVWPAGGAPRGPWSWGESMFTGPSPGGRRSVGLAVQKRPHRHDDWDRQNLWGAQGRATWQVGGGRGGGQEQGRALDGQVGVVGVVGVVRGSWQAKRGWFDGANGDDGVAACPAEVC